MANPINAIEEFMRIKKDYGVLRAVISTMLILFFVPVAILAVMMKVSQVDFITEQIYWDWSVIDWARLAGFINNIAGIIPNRNVEAIKSIFSYIDQKNPELMT